MNLKDIDSCILEYCRNQENSMTMISVIKNINHIYPTIPYSMIQYCLYELIHAGNLLMTKDLMIEIVKKEASIMNSILCLNAKPSGFGSSGSKPYTYIYGPKGCSLFTFQPGLCKGCLEKELEKDNKE